MTSEGHATAVFQRAIERRNLVMAEMVLRAELPRPTLTDRLELAILVAEKDPRRHPRVSARWLACYLSETEGATVTDASLLSALLCALGGPRHDRAAEGLRLLVG